MYSEIKGVVNDTGHAKTLVGTEWHHSKDRRHLLR